MISDTDTMQQRLKSFSVFDWTDSPFGAVFLRELLVALRYQRYAMMLGALSIALIAAILVNLTRMNAGLTSTAEVVTTIVGLQCSALLVVLFFVVPALGAVTTAAERQQETEDLLQMALGDPVSFLAGKLFAMLALFTVFHLALLPFSVFTYFFAGIEVRSFFQITFMLYGTALCHSIIGVAVSRTTPQPGRALFWVFTALFATYVLPSWFDGQSLIARPALTGTTVSWYLNPLPLLRDLLHSLAGWTACFQFLGLQVLATTVVVLACLIGARLDLGPSVAYHLREQRAPTRIPPVPDWANALYHKDCHTLALARPLPTIFSFALGLCGAAAILWVSARYIDLSITPIEVATAILIILTPLLVLDRCGKEMAPNSLLMIRGTRLNSEQVLLGKVLAAIRCLLPLTLGIVAGSLLPLAILSIADLTRGHPDAPTALYLIYQAALLPVKMTIFVVVCFACVRFRSPNAPDLAITLVLSTLLAAGAESIRIGLFETADWKTLSMMHFVMLLVFQGIAASFAGGLLFLVALMRFESVFDEGSDIFAVRHADRSSH